MNIGLRCRLYPLFNRSNPDRQRRGQTRMAASRQTRLIAGMLSPAAAGVLSLGAPNDAMEISCAAGAPRTPLASAAARL